MEVFNMDKKHISEYLAQPDYKNIVLAEYLKDNLKNTKSFILTCTAEELIKVYAVLENVVLHFMDKRIVGTFKTRKGQLKVKIEDNLSRLEEFFLVDNENFLLIKSIVDEMDPLQYLENNASYTCYNEQIKKLTSNICHFSLDFITKEVQKVFPSADSNVIQKLSERITDAFKDGSIKKYILNQDTYITFYPFSSKALLEIDVCTHRCEYYIDEFECDFYDNGHHAFECSSFMMKLLRNELSSTSFDLNQCKANEFVHILGLKSSPHIKMAKNIFYALTREVKDIFTKFWIFITLIT